MTMSSRDGRTPAPTQTIGSVSGSCSGSNVKSDFGMDTDTDTLNAITRETTGGIEQQQQQQSKIKAAVKARKLQRSVGMSSAFSKLGGPARRIVSSNENNYTSALDDIDTTHLSRITEGSSQENPSSSGSGAQESDASEVTSRRTPNKQSVEQPKGTQSGSSSDRSEDNAERDVRQTPLMTRGTPVVGRGTPTHGLMTPRQQMRRQPIDINIAGNLMRDKITPRKAVQQLNQPSSASKSTGLQPVAARASQSSILSQPPVSKAGHQRVSPDQKPEAERGVSTKPNESLPRDGQYRVTVSGKDAAPADNRGSHARSAHVVAGGQAVTSDSGAISRSRTGTRRVREDENTVVVRNTRYVKLECVGKGGSSKVFKVMAPNKKIYALKRIRLSGRESSSASGFLEEITLLKCLQGRDNIIQLIDSEYVQSEGLIYMILECGEIDLARMLSRKEKARASDKDYAPDENFIRLYWQQMLEAVAAIHEERIVHSDLKPANFLFVEGTLKLIDFGIAKTIQNDTTNIVRDSQVGTLNYMSPEAILGSEGKHKLGRASDVWSLGCILYQMVYGTTPFAALPFIQKLHAITDDKHAISFPGCTNVHIDEVMKRCLDRNPRTRITIPELLQHPFLHPEVAPSPAPAPASRPPDSISLDQLQSILLQLSGSNAASVQSITQEALRQIQKGQALDLSNVLASKSSSSEDSITSVEPFETKMQAAAAPPPPAPPPPRDAMPGNHSDGSANAAAGHVLSTSRPALRTIQVAAMDKENITPSQKRIVCPSSLAEECAKRAQNLRPCAPRPAEMNKGFQSEILEKHGKLRHVSPAPRRVLGDHNQCAGDMPRNAIEHGIAAKFQIPLDADAVGDGNTTHDWDD